MANIDASPPELSFGMEFEAKAMRRATMALAVSEGLGVACPAPEAEPYPSEYQRDDPSHYRIADAQGDTWEVKPDHCGSELATPPLWGTQGLQRALAVTSAVSRAGAQVGADTGMHLHVDGKPFITAETGKFDCSKLINLVQLFLKYQMPLYAALQVNSYRKDVYCKPLHASMLATLRRDPPQSHDALERICKAWGRYWGLNLASLFKHGTLEFRLANGTFDPTAIGAVYGSLMGMARQALSSPPLPDEALAPDDDAESARAVKPEPLTYLPAIQEFAAAMRLDADATSYLVNGLHAGQRFAEIARRRHTYLPLCRQAALGERALTEEEMGVVVKEAIPHLAAQSRDVWDATSVLGLLADLSHHTHPEAAAAARLGLRKQVLPAWCAFFAQSCRSRLDLEPGETVDKTVPVLAQLAQHDDMALARAAHAAIEQVIRAVAQSVGNCTRGQPVPFLQAAQKRYPALASTIRDAILQYALPELSRGRYVMPILELVKNTDDTIAKAARQTMEQTLQRLRALVSNFAPRHAWEHGRPEIAFSILLKLSACEHPPTAQAAEEALVSHLVTAWGNAHLSEPSNSDRLSHTLQLAAHSNEELSRAAKQSLVRALITDLEESSSSQLADALASLARPRAGPLWSEAYAALQQLIIPALGTKAATNQAARRALLAFEFGTDRTLSSAARNALGHNALTAFLQRQMYRLKNQRKEQGRTG